MSKIKIALVVLLIVVFLSSLVLISGCKGTVSETTVAETETTAAETETTASETTASEATLKTTAEKVTLRISHGWTTSSDKAGSEEWPSMVDDFAKQYSNLTISQEIVGGDEMFTKIRTDAAADNLPDIMFYWGGNNIAEIAKAGKLLDMEEYLKVSKEVKKEDMLDKGWTYYTIDGKIYGIPLSMYVGYLVYNKEIFDKFGLEPPKTYEEFAKISKVLNENDIIPSNVTSKGGNPGHFWFSDLLMQMPNGREEQANLPTSWNFTTDNILNVAKIIEQQRKDGIFPKDTIANGDWGPAFALYNEGKAAMCYSYPWMSATMKPEIFENSVLMDLPKMPGGTVDPSTIVQGSVNYGFIINAKSWADPNKQPYILAFADWVMTDEIQTALTEQGSIVSVKLAKQGLKDDLNIPQMTKDAINFSKGKALEDTIWDKWPADQPSHSVFVKQLDELFAGNVTAEQFVKTIQAALDEGKTSASE